MFRSQVAGEHPTPVQSGGEAWRQVIQVPASNDYSKSQAARRQIPGILAGDNFFCYGGLKEGGPILLFDARSMFLLSPGSRKSSFRTTAVDDFLWCREITKHNSPQHIVAHS